MTSLRSILLFAACNVGAGCGKPAATEREHELYLEARRTLAAAAARSADDLCPEEPACGQALAALTAIPPESPDHAEAAALVTRVLAARQRGALLRTPPPPAPPREVAATAEPAGAPAAAAPGEAGAAVEPADGKVATAPDGPRARRKNWRENDDDDWSLTVVDGNPLGGETQPHARPSELEDPDEPRAAVVHGWRGLDAPPPAAESCATVRAKIEAREIQIRDSLNGVNGWMGAPSGGVHEAELSERERGDGTKAANFDDDAEVARLKGLLSTCK